MIPNPHDEMWLLQRSREQQTHASFRSWRVCVQDSNHSTRVIRKQLPSDMAAAY